ncbi:MAG: ATP-dependent Clp protease proteolytic subunit [Chloroflexi bacterium]|nr:ATP-dependent Clp protease proteolytic subunit [Chloroflexota bacterium]
MVRLEDLIRDYAARRQELEKLGAYFLGEITAEEAERCAKTLLLMTIERSGFPDRPITIYINSGGGSVGAGLAIMEMIYRLKREYKVTINTVVTGYAYSMGAIVVQAGDKRTMGHFSTMMLHSSSWMLSGEDEKIFKDYQKLAKHYQQIVGELFARRSGQRDARWWTRFIYSGRDKFLSARECLELGLVDEVCDAGNCYDNLADVPAAPTRDPDVPRRR